MAWCLFVASGLEFRMDEFLRASPFHPKTKYYKGEIPPKDNPKKVPRPDSGFVVLVSHDEKGDDISAQRQDAYNFLHRHEGEIQRARIFGADNFLLDFGIELGQQMQTAVYLPPELIEVLSRFQMGLSFSAVQLGRG